MDNAKIVVLICANAEWRAVIEALAPKEVRMTAAGDTFEGRAGRNDLIFLHGGWGKIAAAGSTQYAIDAWRPDLILNLGTCGGFEGKIEVGTILLATKTVVYDIVEKMGDTNEAIKAYTTEIDPVGLAGLETWKPEVRLGVLVSADRDLHSEDIPVLVEKHEAAAADWESGAIAWIAKRNGVKCLILRGVSDLVGTEGGEAYGKLALFHDRTRLVMGNLLKLLETTLGAAIIM